MLDYQAFSMKNLILPVLLLFGISLNAQNIAVGSLDKDMAETGVRNEQLLWTSSPSISLTLRPLSVQQVDTSATKYNIIDNAKLKIDAMPMSFLQQYNTLLPTGRNDGAMIPARGYQTLASAGIYAKYGILSIQFRPEYVFADNKSFEGFPTENSGLITNTVRSNYTNYLNTMDLPSRFGDKSYSRFNLGQSNISIGYGALSVGVSTESLWWGPGQHNSLIMSNNAPGFLHATFNTRRPLKSFLGNFEFQVVSGKLESSGIKSPKSLFVIDGTDYETVKRDEWRYMNGISINYQPKWIPGLFLGFNRTFQTYHSDLGNGIKDYLPIFISTTKSGTVDEDTKNRDQLASVFFRWVMPEANFEFYGEYGKNDYEQNIRDVVESIEHSRAYMIGMTKLFLVDKSSKQNYFRMNIEFTTMEQTADRIARPAGAWYQHGQVLEGYTNRGKVMGAGIGPGGNSQTFDFSYWKKRNNYGFQVERYAHNLDFYYDVFTTPSNKWIDFSLNTYAYRRYGKFSFLGKFNTILVGNYQYQKPNDKFNFQLQLSLQYRL